MVETIRSLADLLILLANNTTGNITEEIARDILVSSYSGYGAYQDLATKTTPIAGLAGISKKITCDNAGTNTYEDKLAYGFTAPNALWNPTLNRIPFGDMEEGELVGMRLDATVTPSAINTNVQLHSNFYNSGGGLVFTLDRLLGEVKLAVATPINVYTSFYVGTTLVGGYAEFYLECSNDFDLEVGGFIVDIKR